MEGMEMTVRMVEMERRKGRKEMEETEWMEGRKGWRGRRRWDRGGGPDSEAKGVGDRRACGWRWQRGRRCHQALAGIPPTWQTSRGGFGHSPARSSLNDQGALSALGLGAAPPAAPLPQPQ